MTAEVPEMVERVARAIERARRTLGAQPIAELHLEGIARAAIEAMRLDHQADTELGYAGHRAMFQGEPETHSAYVAIDGWNAMIDAALSKSGT